MKKFSVYVGMFLAMVVCAMAQEGSAGFTGAVTEAQEWITWGVSAIGAILVAGIGIYGAKWAYRTIIKGGLGNA